MEKTYPSKIDAWLLVLYWGAVIYLLWRIAGVFILRTSPNVNFGLQTILLLLLLVIITFSFFYPFRYHLDKRALTIKGGLFWRKTIDFSSIVSTEILTSAANGPALSLQKVVVKYQENGLEKAVFISPAQREKFVKALSEQEAANT